MMMQSLWSVARGNNGADTVACCYGWWHILCAMLSWMKQSQCDCCDESWHCIVLLPVMLLTSWEWLKPVWLMAPQHPAFDQLTIQHALQLLWTNNFSGFVTGALLCLVLWINHLPPVRQSNFGKSILKKLFCKFTRMFFFTQGQFWPLGIVVACICLCAHVHVCVSRQ